MSTVKFDTWQNTDGTENYKCRAWVRFTGNGPSINDSGNVSSLTDNATGNFTINFSNAMPDANYSTVATSNRQGVTTADVPMIAGVINNASFYSTTGVAVVVGWPPNGTLYDCEIINVAVFR